MSTATILRIDPATTAPDTLEPWLVATHVSRTASWPLDQPFEPTETLAAWRACLLAPWSGDPVRLLVAADHDDRVLGHALVELPVHDNPHVGLLELHVAAHQRRRGLGRSLLAAAAGLLRQERRRTLIIEARVGSALEAFAAAAGAQPKCVEVRRDQQIGALDLIAVSALRGDAERAAAGYRVEGWVGRTPEHRLADLGRLIETLNDAPLGGLDYDDERWDAERVARRDRFVEVARLRLHVLLAFAADGTPAGYTEVAVSEDGTYGWQWGTGVDPEHRGHRLGLLLKAAMVERLRAQEPALRVVSTWNAAENQHMIRINELLGYVPVDQATEWQLAIG